MFKAIRTSKFTKGVIYYLVLMLFIEMTQPIRMYALTSGPKQPEFTSFTPISTSDMVNLTSGDFNYNIPIMDVGGYPINLAYDSGVTMDQEASWVGLGWNLNVGQVTRQVRGLPDDFRGDVVNYKNNMKDNVTIGANFNLSPAVFGNDFPFSLGLGAQYNNYNGVSFTPSIGISYSIAGIGEVGVSLSGNVEEGATLSPSIGLSTKIAGNTSASLGLSAGLNSRKGLENMGMSISTSTKSIDKTVTKEATATTEEEATYSVGKGSQSVGSIGGSLSFNNQSYTPTKRIGYHNNNKTFNATLGGEAFGVEGQVRITGYGSVQSISSEYKNKNVAAFGYENTQYKNSREGVLDFNREKEQVISKNTNALPVTNYTYDIYNIEGQGVSGMFRPIRSQVSYLYNDDVSDNSSSSSFGAEIGFGNLVHGGVNFNDAPTKSKTGRWTDNNMALTVFSESNNDIIKNPLYQTTTFKLVGELDVDKGVDNGNRDLYLDRIKETRPLRLKLDDDEINPSLLPIYLFKPNVNLAQAATNYTPNVLPVSTKIKRAGRLLRNQTIQKITANEADGKFIFRNINAKDHHTAGMKVLQNNGTTYVFGKSVYNKEKIEATFDVSGRNQNPLQNEDIDGLITYSSSMSQNSSTFSDRFENRITTPAYAHTFLLTSILSTDYEDLKDDGPTDDDLGSYTKFNYTEKRDKDYIPDYKWRVPFQQFKASYNEGLKSSTKDQKGNYIYGEKELTYLKRIETKTHVAFIDLDSRHDAMGVINKDGGASGTAMKCIKSIRLYSKSELLGNNISLDEAQASNASNPIAIQPIKTAHFNYNYSLCKGIPSSDIGEGKLTLESLYFTYRASNMGKFTPYVFNYGQDNTETNADYGIKSFDIWGNYKPSSTFLPTTDFPFVEQDYDIAAKNTAMWVLKTVTLPSGGVIKITTESDDYKYVQNRKAMQMFHVVGAGNAAAAPINNLSDRLYTLSGGHNRYIYVQTNNPSLSVQDFKRNYLEENMGKPIYFKFLVKMHGSSYDYVSGYFEIDQSRLGSIQVNGGIASIPLKFLRKDGGPTANDQVNPIAKAGWGFGRSNLNRFVYGGGDEVSADFVSIVKNLVKSIGAMAEIFTGPNRALELRHCADRFDKQRSWIRLENPIGRKFGGGLRVQKIELSDEWDVMNNNDDNPIYGEMYGQEYSYRLEDGSSSSGVASFEPNASPENPFVEPFYGNDNQNYAERIGAPRESNYIEKPFGENFFPGPKVTYSRVTVTNLDKTHDLGDINLEVKKHATGKVITEHYTTKDFPTIVDYTDYDVRLYNYKSPLLQMLSVYSQSHLTASQGFTIETNDMDGKMKSQKVFAEGQNSPISRVDYKYNIDSNGRLSSLFTTIDETGKIDPRSLLGINYDVINDFNQSTSVTNSFGFDANIASFLVGIFPVFVPIILPREAYNETQLRTATTTKVIHKTAVLVETIAYDLGSRVATKNLAWDAKTGQILLTQTTNEFDENYYSFNFPSYWFYKNMGMASENIDLSGKLIETNTSGNSFFYLDGFSPLNAVNNINKFFKIGDELVFNDSQRTKLWVYDINSNHIRLMNKDGEVIDSSNQPSDMNFKITRSGNRNLQTASMASVTLMKNPILTTAGLLRTQLTNDAFGYENSNDVASSKVINASAVEYGDDWKSQCENNLPNEYGLIAALPGTPVNPYLYNIKGDWRAVKSYAYLTGRNNFQTTNRRNAGFFKKFKLFYELNKDLWNVNVSDWTFASKVTMYSPYGVELENEDALKRPSSAQYGYNYTLPMAVASNSKYREIGFDGFEDYNTNDILNQVPSPFKPHFGFSQGVYNQDQNAYITSNKSHTGNNSVAVNPGKSVKFIRRVDGCPPENIDEKMTSRTSKQNNN